MNRREFMTMIAGAGVSLCAGCKSLETGPAGAARTINAGPVGAYAADGVYDRLRAEGFFVVRQNGKLFALSSICTHRQCGLLAEPNRTFLCPCHGSTFDPAGKVTEGPATRDMPVLPTTTDSQGNLLVTVTA